MSEVKLLNLDDIGETEVVTIVLNGNSHKLTEMSVQNFIWVQKEIKRQSGSADEIAVFESLVSMLSRQFPSVSPEEFNALPMSKLRRLMDFVNSIAQQGAEGVTKTTEEGANPPTAEQTA